MYVLAIDNSLDSLTITLSHSNGVITTTSQTAEIASAVIADELNGVLSRSGLVIDDVGAVFVTTGPGSYTGIRVSLAFCKGLCSARHIPLIGIPTLDVLATPLAHMEGRFLCPLVDARKGEVFTALYQASRGQLNRLTPYQAIRPENVPTFVRTPCICFGTGVAASMAYIASADGIAVEGNNYSAVTPESLIRVGMEMFACDPPYTAQPIYGRRSEAEIRLHITVD